MSKKGNLKKEIANLEKEIEALEKKRARSQSAIMTAMIKKVQPDPMDEEYFRVFSALIDSSRETLRQRMEELDSLK